MKATAKSELIAILCLLILAGGSRAIAQEYVELRTVGPDRVAKLRAFARNMFAEVKADDLISTGTTILEALESAHARGLPLIAANLSGADLSGAQLSGAKLRGADLTEANLRGANLSDAYLTGGDLSGADLSGADLNGAFLPLKIIGANLSEANLRWARMGGDFSKANLSGADLRDAELGGANLSGANLSKANLSGADLDYAILVEANLNGADLSGASLVDSDITSADLTGVVLRECRFEPRSSYSLENGLPSLEGLDKIQYAWRKEPLVGMRNAFKEGGYLERERAVTAGIKRRDNALRPAQLRIQLHILLLRYLSWVTYDSTRAYGFKNLWPLQILFGVWAAWSAFYYLIFRFAHGTTGVDLVVPYQSEKGKELEHKYPIRPRMETPAGWPRAPSLIATALYFSLLSAFNLRFRRVEVGGWIRQLQTQTFDLRPLGWVLTLSVIQTLLTVSLLALWVWSTFGRSFGG